MYETRYCNCTKRITARNARLECVWCNATVCETCVMYSYQNDKSCSECWESILTNLIQMRCYYGRGKPLLPMRTSKPMRSPFKI